MLQAQASQGEGAEGEEEYWWAEAETETETDTGMAEADADHWEPWVPQEPLIPEPQALCALVVQLKARFCKKQ